MKLYVKKHDDGLQVDGIVNSTIASKKRDAKKRNNVGGVKRRKNGREPSIRYGDGVKSGARLRTQWYRWSFLRD